MDTGRQRTASAKWPLERGAAQTLESQVGSAGIQNVAFNMLRVTWNPLKQGGLPTFSMRSSMRPEDLRHPQIFQTRQEKGRRGQSTQRNASPAVTGRRAPDGRRVTEAR